MSSYLNNLPPILFSQDNRVRISFISVTSVLFLLSILVVCLMPVSNQTPERHLERHITIIIGIALIIMCPLSLVAVSVNHPSLNNAVLIFMVGIGSGSLCAITFSMIFTNLLLTFLDIITGKFRLQWMEIIGINVLMIALTFILYFKTSLSRELYSYYLEIEKNLSNNRVDSNSSVESNNSGVSVQEIAKNGSKTTGKQMKASKKSGSYDFN